MGSFFRANSLESNPGRDLIRNYLMYYLSVSISCSSYVSAYLSVFSPYGPICCRPKSIYAALGEGFGSFVKRLSWRFSMALPVGVDV